MVPAVVPAAIRRRPCATTAPPVPRPPDAPPCRGDQAVVDRLAASRERPWRICGASSTSQRTGSGACSWRTTSAGASSAAISLTAPQPTPRRVSLRIRSRPGSLAVALEDPARPFGAPFGNAGRHQPLRATPPRGRWVATRSRPQSRRVTISTFSCDIACAVSPLGDASPTRSGREGSAPANDAAVRLASVAVAASRRSGRHRQIHHPTPRSTPPATTPARTPAAPNR